MINNNNTQHFYRAMSITSLSSKHFFFYKFTLYRTSVIILTPPPLLLTYIVLYPIKNYKLQYWTWTKVKNKQTKNTNKQTHTLQKNRQVLWLQRQCSHSPKHRDRKMHPTDWAVSHSLTIIQLRSIEQFHTASYMTTFVKRQREMGVLTRLSLTTSQHHNQQTRELISSQETSHKHKHKDLSHLR